MPSKMPCGGTFGVFRGVFPVLFPGTPAIAGNCSLFLGVTEKSVRNIAGNKDDLGTVGLDPFLFLLARPAQLGEHIAEQVQSTNPCD